ncbi:hybrid sensor histidine kinase/response regulator [Waterburya agarophytonicola K14]|uniref:histidine kinase n=1 Tax=Waterburya agarophytonicola KI4 TaxID=2874699 RepID=A0A964BQ56_9CYAN|nr:hybrid sensor histidine kinase/response regulator [Waterburya agarophytonicola]MCC0177544.1 hybrid sensor histidine kinase/response regulator [Waterburya agarophytonicola KI4]
MDTDRQVRLDFLEEAEEYFDSLESLLMDLDTQGADPSLLDSAMRAAHSLKGGAAMMRFVPLSKIAHRLEDFLKILRVRKDNSLIDREVTNLLLRGVDCLREARNLHRQQVEIDESWFANHTEPIFEVLRARLGDLREEDEDLLLAEEEQVDVSSLIFQSGVEDCLESFQAQIDLLEPIQLKEELAIQAQQLAEFGQMSQIEPFIQLCQSVLAELAVVSLENVKDLAQEALKQWERSHALVLVGRIDKLPTNINGNSGKIEPSKTANFDISTPNITDLVNGVELAEIQDFTAQELAPHLPLSESELDLDELTPSAAELSELDGAFLSLDNFESSSTPDIDLDELAPDAAELSELNDAFDSIDLPSTVQADTTKVEIDLDKLAPDAAELLELNDAFAEIEVSTPEPESVSPQRSQKEQGRMVRVPAERLQSLNNLSSKLILERNAAILRLNQLQNYVDLTRDRMRRLEQSSNRLRKLYDWASLEGMIPANQSPAMTVNASWSGVSSSTSEKFDSLEMDRYSDLHLLSQEQMETIVQLQEVTADIDLGVREMGQVIRNFSYTTRELQQNVTRSQMRPFAELVGRFPRLIRDLSTQHNKEANLIIEGKATYIDRQALELLSDPLTHLLRNAFDHGLENTQTRIEAGKSPEGTIILKAIQQGNRTVITISDDGGGINSQKIRDRLLKLGFSQTQVNQISETDVLDAIFEPGFSTAEQVTELSGRGVGMDVVRSNLEQIRGDIQVNTELGKGTTFTISVPLSLLVLRVVIVESAGMVFAIPVNSIKEIIKFDDELSLEQDGGEKIVWGKESVALLRLKKHFEFKRPSKPFEMEGNPKIATPTVLIFEENARFKGIYLDKYWNEQEVAIRPVKTSIPLFPGFTGSTVLGDGRVIPLIEPVALSKGITKQQRASFSTLTTTENVNDDSNFAFSLGDTSTILVVDDSVNVRRYLAGILERNGYRVEEAKDGRDAVDKLMGGLQVQAMICDVEMPRLDGYGVLSEVKSEPSLEHIPIAMLTSRSNDKHRKLAMKLGASAYFSKPFNEQEMLQTLQSLIVSG